MHVVHVRMVGLALKSAEDEECWIDASVPKAMEEHTVKYQVFSPAVILYVVAIWIPRYFFYCCRNLNPACELPRNNFVAASNINLFFAALILTLLRCL